MQIQLFALFAVLFTPAFGVVIRSPEPLFNDQVDAPNALRNNLQRANPPPAFKRITNAERLKRGLGPLPPTKRSSGA